MVLMLKRQPRMQKPLALPAGNYDELMDMVVTLNPRDTLR